MAFNGEDMQSKNIQSMIQQMMETFNNNIESKFKQYIHKSTNSDTTIKTTNSIISSATKPIIDYDNKKENKDEEDLINGQIQNKYSKRNLFLQSMIDQNDELDQVEEERAKIKKEKRLMRSEMLKREQLINNYQTNKRKNRELKRLKDKKKAERDKIRLKNLNFILKQKKIKDSDEEMEEDLR